MLRNLANEGYSEMYGNIVHLKFTVILTMLGEATTTKLHRDRDSQGLGPLKKDAQEGGAVAGSTRRDIEKRSGKPVVTGENFKRLAGKGKKNL